MASRAEFVPPYDSPTITSLPSACRAMAWMWLRRPKSTLARPSRPKLSSTVPSAMNRMTPCWA